MLGTTFCYDPIRLSDPKPDCSGPHPCIVIFTPNGGFATALFYQILPYINLMSAEIEQAGNLIYITFSGPTKELDLMSVLSYFYSFYKSSTTTYKYVHEMVYSTIFWSTM